MKTIHRAAAVLAALVLAAGLSAQGSVVILDYHTFLGTGSSTLDYSEQELGGQLDRMAALGYKFVTLEDAVAGKVQGRANIVVTIDDGNHSVYGAVKRVFLPRGVKPFLFVYGGIVGQRRFALSADQLRELAAAGCGVGAHGWFHEYMTPHAWKTNPAKVMLEVKNSGPALAKVTGVQPTLFAYPFGVGSPEAAAELAKVGYQWLFWADTEVTPVDFAAPGLDRQKIPRTLAFRWNERKLFQKLENLLKTE